MDNRQTVAKNECRVERGSYRCTKGLRLDPLVEASKCADTKVAQSDMSQDYVKKTSWPKKAHRKPNMAQKDGSKQLKQKHGGGSGKRARIIPRPTSKDVNISRIDPEILNDNQWYFFPQRI